MPARMLPRSHPSRIRARLGYPLTRLPVVPTSLGAKSEHVRNTGRRFCPLNAAVCSEDSSPGSALARRKALVSCAGPTPTGNGSVIIPET